jgi:putative membrane protein
MVTATAIAFRTIFLKQNALNVLKYGMAYHRLIVSAVIKWTNERGTMKLVVLNKFVLAAAVCFFAARVFGDDNMSSTNPPATILPADFAWDASLINLKEIRLGEAAQTNSQNADVQEFGRRMVRDHSRLNARLEKIAQSEGLSLPDTNTFYVPVTPPENKEATQLMAETPQQKLLDAQVDVQSLASLSGTAFDQAYAAAMVKGHQMAMDKFQNASATLSDEPLKKYADRGLRVIHDHYDMAQKLESEVSTNTPAGATNAAPGM